MGPLAGRAWAEARDAVTTIRVIDRAWTALADLTGLAPASVDPTLRLADLTLEQFEKVGRKADPWSIVRAGGTIDLADRITIRERTEKISRARQQRQSQAEESYREKARRTHGTAIVR